MSAQGDWFPEGGAETPVCLRPTRPAVGASPSLYTRLLRARVSTADGVRATSLRLHVTERTAVSSAFRHRSAVGQVLLLPG